MESLPTLNLNNEVNSFLDKLVSVHTAGGLDNLQLAKQLQFSSTLFPVSVEQELISRIYNLDPQTDPNIKLTRESSDQLRFYLSVGRLMGLDQFEQYHTYFKEIDSRLAGYPDRKTSRRNFLKRAATVTAGLVLPVIAPDVINAITTRKEQPTNTVPPTEPPAKPSPIPPKPAPTSTIAASPTETAKPAATATSTTETTKTATNTTTATYTASPTETATNTPSPTETTSATPTEQPAAQDRILYPAELSDSEVREWVGKLRNSHDAVITESLFTKELAAMSANKRQQVLKAISQAHADALIKYYGDSQAIIGLDPGHGGSDIGSSAQTFEGEVIYEKDLTWELAQMTAQEIHQKTQGKYMVVMLRPKEPIDEDLDRDGVISAVERIQKRKALLLKMERDLRPDPKDRGKNIVYLSLHFNGSPDSKQQGIETFWPNSVGTNDDNYRGSSQKLALLLQQTIRDRIRSTGYQVSDRGAKEDPDRRLPRSNSDTIYGPYVALDSPKLDRVLKA